MLATVVVEGAVVVFARQILVVLVLGEVNARLRDVLGAKAAVAPDCTCRVKCFCCGAMKGEICFQDYECR